MGHAASSRPISGVGARRADVVEMLGLYRVPDSYRWLEDAGDPASLRALDADIDDCPDAGPTAPPGRLTRETRPLPL